MEWRRKLVSHFGTSILDNLIIQTLLGFEKKSSKIIDRLGNFSLEYDINSGIGSAYFYNGCFEEGEIAFFEKILKGIDSPVILDVGANIGTHSIRWAKINRKTKVFAFEPSPTTAQMLEQNVERNRLKDQIKVFATAVSESPGTARFYHCVDDAYSSLKDTGRYEVIDIIEVQVTTIDAFCKEQGLKKINLIKVDVEGFETEVIKGAIETLKKYKPELFIEIYAGTNSNKDPERTIKIIQDLGYHTFVLSKGKKIEWSKHSDSQQNYYFTAHS